MPKSKWNWGFISHSDIRIPVLHSFFPWKTPYWSIKKSKCTIYHLYNSLTDHWRWLITVSIHCRLMYPVTHSLKIATMTYSLEFATLRYRQELATLTHTQLPTLTSPVSVCQSLSLPSVSADTPRPPGVASRLTTYTPTKQRHQSYQWESVACITT